MQTSGAGKGNRLPHTGAKRVIRQPTSVTWCNTSLTLSLHFVSRFSHSKDQERVFEPVAAVAAGNHIRPDGD